MIIPDTFWKRPGWLFCALLLLTHFASLKLTSLCAITQDNVVVVWLPNAVLLTALLRTEGRRLPLLAAVTLCSELLGNLGSVNWLETILLSVVNLSEVLITFVLLQRTGACLRLQRLEDLVKFILAGPLLGALIASLLAALVLQQVSGATSGYLTLVRLWWFGDALGLLIYTPLLLAFVQPSRQEKRITRFDNILVAITVLMLVAAVAIHFGGAMDQFTGSPTLLLPCAAVIAFRFGIRWTSVFVALLSLSITVMMTTGLKPFGDLPMQLQVLRAQEFIFTLCLIGIGFAVLLEELQVRELELESRVKGRTLELERSNLQLAAISNTDGLTGIPNRRQFDETLNSEWSRARRNGQGLMLVMLDVDFFKQYNDHYGHQAGDDALRHVALALRDHVRRSGDFVARYGGEEFAIISQCSSEDHAMLMAEMVCKTIDDLQLPHVKSPFKNLTASVGVALIVPDQHTTTIELLKAADRALYFAKQRGRNRVEVADAVPG